MNVDNNSSYFGIGFTVTGFFFPKMATQFGVWFTAFSFRPESRPLNVVVQNAIRISCRCFRRKSMDMNKTYAFMGGQCFIQFSKFTPSFDLSVFWSRRTFKPGRISGSDLVSCRVGIYHLVILHILRSSRLWINRSAAASQQTVQKVGQA